MVVVVIIISTSVVVVEVIVTSGFGGALVPATGTVGENWTKSAKSVHKNINSKGQIGSQKTPKKGQIGLFFKIRVSTKKIEGSDFFFF